MLERDAVFPVDPGQTGSPRPSPGRESVLRGRKREGGGGGGGGSGGLTQSFRK